jgi:mannose-1-phosphate guanylyltransferase
MGTAGGINHFRDEILRGNPDAFFVLNGDIASSFPLQSLITSFKSTNAVATVLAAPKDKKSAQKYGCMVVNPKGLVEHFVEKPESFISNLVSCGIYLFSKELFKFYNDAVANSKGDTELYDITDFSANQLAASNAMLASRGGSAPVHIEHDIFPYLVQKKALYAVKIGDDDFWMAIKAGSSTIVANRSYLQHFLLSNPKRLTTHSPSRSPMESPVQEGVRTFPEIIQPAFIHPTAVVHPTAKIGPNVFIGARTLIGRGVRVRDALILDSCEVKNDACVINAVVGWECKIGAWSRVEGSNQDENIHESATQKGFKIPSAAILGKDVTVADEVIIRDCIVLPHKQLKVSFQREIVM